MNPKRGMINLLGLNRNISKFDEKLINFIDTEEFVLNSGKQIILGTYEIHGNHVLVIFSRDDSSLFQEFSFSRQEIWNDYQFLKNLFVQHEQTAVDYLKMAAFSVFNSIKSFLRQKFSL